ncbi:AmmeMemoRadiSam system protein B [Acidocella sp.]|uniref:AmmeMemoRadiSam system protein B n=1 Tax=Acidocella sp. TaxID=50710 RepID=UPI00262AE4AE|nr:AmmeMemoRadiSam system protein B [Acidocella sp.]
MLRPPAVAGAFYPADAVLLRQMVTGFLQDGTPEEGVEGDGIKALIVPHAGYIYSGAIAGRAYGLLAGQARRIRRVVLVGPVHRVAVRGLALPGADKFATPIGEIAVDQGGVAKIAGMAQVVVSEEAHALEHSLEVQLPFLQSVLGSFTLVPLAVGNCTAEEVADVLEALWGGDETLIVISSDLSHFLAQETAERVDGETVARILHGEPLYSFEQACGALPINGLMLAAARHHLAPRLVARGNSGDAGGERARVVGYAAIEFCGHEG